MLVIVMHNKKYYLDALRTILSREGIFDSTIIEEDNIGKRLIGDSASFISQTGTLRPAYDKALVATVRGGDKLENILKILKNEMSLKAFNMEDKGFVCTLPFSHLKSLTLETVKLERKTKLDIKVSGLLKKENILLELEAKDSKEAIYKVAETLKGSDNILDFDGFIEKVLEREMLSTTGIGDGVAIPHARTRSVKDLIVGFGRFPSGVNFRSLDGKYANLVFLIGSPPGEEKVKYYLEILARLAKLLRDVNFRDKLLYAKTAEEIVGFFNETAGTIK